MTVKEIKKVSNEELVELFDRAVTNAIKAANGFGKSEKFWNQKCEQVKEEILKRMK